MPNQNGSPQRGPSKPDELRYGPLAETCFHLCVDMQRMFAEKTGWHMPWMARVLPVITELVSTHPERTYPLRPRAPSGTGQRNVAFLL